MNHSASYRFPAPVVARRRAFRVTRLGLLVVGFGLALVAGCGTPPGPPSDGNDALAQADLLLAVDSSFSVDAARAPDLTMPVTSPHHAVDAAVAPDLAADLSVPADLSGVADASVPVDFSLSVPSDLAATADDLAVPVDFAVEPDLALLPDLAAPALDFAALDLGPRCDGAECLRCNFAGCPSDGGQCEVDAGRCVECLGDADCGLGLLCVGSACVPGCSAQHGCPAALSCCGGLCKSLVGDVAHCGACGASCSPANIAAACVAGDCTGACDPGYADCNSNKRGDGCEVSIDADPANCGACGAACSAIHVASPSCASGRCQGACSGGFADCNSDLRGDGCEVALGTDAQNCGACGSGCSNNNIDLPACTGAACTGACNTGFADCNSDRRGDGCEVNLRGDVQNCGGCGVVCPDVNSGHATCTNGVCGIDCAVGYTRCGGACTVTDTDVLHCGGCGAACSSNNVTRACTGGACTGACVGGYLDCNGDLRSDGCEVNGAIDVNHCGTCGTVCTPPNARAACVAGSCAVAQCDTGYADCDQVAADGCEVDLGGDVSNCGRCGSACVLPHAKPMCSSGACTVASCDAGFADCDAVASNGCEVDSTGDVNNCGACGKVCSLPFATSACAASACIIARCAPGHVDCNGLAADGCEVDITSDALHCGSCGLACSTNHVGPVCAAGLCAGACATGYTDCNADKASDGCEVYTDGDTQNCGGCGRACGGQNVVGSACTVGACTGTCVAGYSDCNANLRTDGCEVQTSADVSNCGGCGVVCSTAHVPVPACTAGACAGACAAGFADCNSNKQQDGCETPTAGDPQNCGACGHVCPGAANGSATCAAGVCGLSCALGYTQCGALCRDTDVDVVNCGGCGVVCSTKNIARTCTGGTCDGNCSGYFADCNGDKQVDGCEVNTQTDVANCGGCSASCAGTNMSVSSCFGGNCAGVCLAGYADCNNSLRFDGCEVQTASDPLNCGGCGVQCSTVHVIQRSCDAGACSSACAAGFADCNSNKQTDGCETGTNSDVNNCGACGHTCPGVANGFAVCNGGVCGLGCNGGYTNACGICVNFNNDLSHCGACGLVCSTNNIAAACSAGVCAGACLAGFADCNGNKQVDGCEVDTRFSVVNCGGCGQACSGQNVSGSACNDGLCTGTCAPGYLDCNNSLRADGCEVHSAVDLLNCGGCGQTCAGTNVTGSACLGGACTGSCAAGYSDCNTNLRVDGCEVQTTTDVNNCGGCGVVCSSLNVAQRTCAAGACTSACSPGYSDCNTNKQADGCETATGTDVNNCGACGKVCPPAQNGSATCTNGQCGVACSPGYTNACGGCVNLGADVSNCGACGLVCSSQNVMPSCSVGQCVGACSPGFEDCNGNKQIDGCEVSTRFSATNCGGCGAACSGANMQAALCSDGLCAGTCQGGYADCNSNLRVDGCEIAIASDTQSCGACGAACSTSHVISAACTAGSCVGACQLGYADCNADLRTDGCEVSVYTSVTSCGSCGAACSGRNVQNPTCTLGACTGGCAAGFSDCNTDLRTDGCEVATGNDPGNCGACGVRCSPLNIAVQGCSSGVCNGTCVSGFADCNSNKLVDGCEVDVTTSAANCGACGQSCSTNHVSGASCTAGQCDSACIVGFGDCNTDKLHDGCETALNTLTNCGGCGVVCQTPNAAPTCDSGTCRVLTCNTNWADCDGNAANGCETYVAGDVSNCGACKSTCSTNNILRSCSAGSCELGFCAPGFADCNGSKRIDGCEQDITADPNNCGGCGAICSTTNITPTCTSGVCSGTCNTGFADCNGNLLTDGCEVDLSSDARNCGTCGVQCTLANAVNVCAAGSCAIGTCQPGFRDCDGAVATGCEKNINTDAANCGACGTTCSAQNIVTVSCAAGTCNGACATGFADCNSNKQADGCEQNIATNTASCGACGVRCSNSNMATITCVAGSCNGSCAANYGDCNSNKQSDGCETNLLGDANNCGACGIVCGVGKTCQNGACSNGTCSNPNVIPAGIGSYTVNDDTTGHASNYTSSTIGYAQSAGPEVVYMIAPAAASRTITASLCASTATWDSVVWVTKTTCSGNGVGGNDDGCGTFAGLSVYTFTAAANTSYMLFVDGYSGSSKGAYTLKVTGL